MNSYELSLTAPSRQRVYRFHHLGTEGHPPYLHRHSQQTLCRHVSCSVKLLRSSQSSSQSTAPFELPIAISYVKGRELLRLPGTVVRVILGSDPYSTAYQALRFSPYAWEVVVRVHTKQPVP